MLSRLAGLCLGLLAASLSCWSGSRPEAQTPGGPASAVPSVAQAPSGPVRLRFRVRTQGPAAAQTAFATFTGRDASGRFCRLDRDGRFLPCTPADNVIPRDGRTWCDYGIPIHQTAELELSAGLRVDSGRIYLSVGAPVLLRVDEASGGLVQPDPANPGDPNRDLLYDWVELALDGSGFHGNTTCVDQFGLPVTLAVRDRSDPGRLWGPVGIQEARDALFAAYRREVPPVFQELADPRERRILAPAHGAFGPGRAQAGYLEPYLDAMWRKYQAEPLVLTPDEGTFTGRVEADGGMRFTRTGDPAAYRIRRRPTSAEVLLCNGVLAEGEALEKVLGAQVAALLNRHLLERPQAWREPAAYYRQEPCNSYARFWHRHSLGGKAYGFAYDDVADQSASLAAPDPLEVLIEFRCD
jgi:hypothetical protein